MSKLPVTESDLHAYVDAALPEARRAEVESHLAARPEAAQRVRDYQSQTEALRALFSPVLDEPLPEQLRALSSPPRAATVERPRRSLLARWSLQRIAAPTNV